MVVQHNLSAMNANRYLGINNSKLSKSLEKLSSGYAINRAGDNAAGLAVSEKMRSQIAGMTQGVKNAQDGISMVQTFEGALTETDSILQRMKTLADQMATGSYQDEVDREAAQLEFDQLNDELDQIADTDFNGVVALNGGQMADGTTYVEKNGSKVFDYRSGATGSTTTAARTEAADVGADARLEDKGYLVEADAKAAWAAGALDGGDAKYLDATFVRDENGSWSLQGVKNDSGEEVNSTVTVADKAAKNGGFTVTAGGKEISNVVLDNIKGIEGDTITIRYTNPNGEPAVGPTNIGWQDVTQNDGVKLGTGTWTNPDVNDFAQIGISLDAGVKTAYENGDESVQNAIEALDNGELTLEFGSSANTTNNVSITGASMKLGTANITSKANAAAIAGTAGSDTWEYCQADNSLYYDGTKIATLDLSKVKTDGTAAHTQQVTYKVAVAGYSAGGDSEGPDANIVVADAANTNTKEPVSESNAFKKGYNNLTYTDHIILQVGARSKDAVDFTFKYNSEGIGELDADMDCSSRGLKTNELSLSNAEAANYAIDRIDSAINKVSMVRATFGAVQNRLEHKIDNLNVSVENLTSAESQIRDTNMPQEMMNFTKQQILAQASQSMLAQANQLPQGVLSLLQ